MTANYTSGGGSGYDYVQSGAPSNAKEGDEWYETDTNTAYVYDGAAWIELTVTDHGQLSGVTAADHHAKPTGGSGIGFDSTNNEFDALLGNALGIDANGNIQVQEGNVAVSNLSGYPIGTSDLGFDTATQTELNNHTANSTAHHTPPNLNTETGSFSPANSSSGRTTVSLSNSYNTLSVSVGINYAADNAEAMFYGATTDANGNYDGFKVEWNTPDFSGYTVRWMAEGELV